MPIIRKDVLAAALCFVEPKRRAGFKGVWICESGYIAASNQTVSFMANAEGVTGSFMIPYAVAKQVLVEADFKLEVTPTRCDTIDYESPTEFICPEFARAFPDVCSGVMGHFDVAQLARVQRAAKILDYKVRAYGPAKGLFDLWHNGDGPAGVMFHQRPDCRAIVMPYRGGGTPWSKL